MVKNGILARTKILSLLDWVMIAVSGSDNGLGKLA